MDIYIILLVICSSILLGYIFRCISAKADSEYKETKAIIFKSLSVLCFLIFLIGLLLLLEF